MKPESTTRRYRFDKKPIVDDLCQVFDWLTGDLPVRELHIRPEYSPQVPAPWGGGQPPAPASYVLEITLEGEK